MRKLDVHNFLSVLHKKVCLLFPFFIVPLDENQRKKALPLFMFRSFRFS